MNRRTMLLWGLATIVLGTARPTLADSLLPHADDIDAHAKQYLLDLQQTSGALDALTVLTGLSFPMDSTTPLTPAQTTALDGLLFKSDGTHSLAYTDPQKAAQSWTPALNYLQALQQANGAIPAIESLTGQTLPSTTDSPLPAPQLEFLFSQLYTANGQQTVAYTDPTRAASAAAPGAAYLNALRQTPGALAALSYVTGQALPSNGPLSGDQLVYLFGQLFQEDGSLNTAFNDPNAAAEAMVHAAAYLKALRDNPGALDAFNAISDQKFSATGPLDVDQVQFLFAQLFDADSKPTLAYRDPTLAAQKLTASLKTSRWKYFFIGAVLAGLVTAGMLSMLSHVSGRTGAIASFTAAGIVLLLGFLWRKHSVRPPVATVGTSVVSTTLSLAASPPSLASHASSNGKALNASDLEVVEAGADIIGNVSPVKAYVPFYADGTTRTSDSIKATYAEGRWLATATGGHVSMDVEQTAAITAGSAAKRTGVIVIPHAVPFDN